MYRFVCLFVSLVAFLGAHQFSQDQLNLFASLKPSEEFLDAFPFETYKVCRVKNGDAFYVDLENDTIKTWLARGVVWEDHLKKYMRKYVRQGSIVLDLGAHIGTHTMTLARLVGPKGHVFAFEPQSKLCRELYHNLKLNKISNVIPLQCAISDSRGKTAIRHVDGNEGGSGIATDGEKVSMRTLDSLDFKNISFMKIDVEGHEDFLIRGAHETILRSHPVILIELLPSSFPNPSKSLKKQLKRHKTIRQLGSLGYKITHISNDDYLAIPRK